MEKARISYAKLSDLFYEHNRTHNVHTQFSDAGARRYAVIVFKRESWPDQHYGLTERSYKVASDNKAFIPGQAGASLFGDCLDGKDIGVRLDQYMREAGWLVDYCYLCD